MQLILPDINNKTTPAIALLVVEVGIDIDEAESLWKQMKEMMEKRFDCK